MKKKRKVHLIDVLILLTILFTIGNFIYRVSHLREALDGLRTLDFFVSIIFIAAVIIAKRWINSS